MHNTVYIRLKKNIELKHPKQIKLKDIAYTADSYGIEDTLSETPIYRMTKQDYNTLVIDGFLVIKHLKNEFSDVDFQLVGPEESIIRITDSKRKTPVLVVAFVWLLLFIGTAMTIMNFHYDVSMQEVQQKLHYIITGKQNDTPLWLQIPYSIGLGAGMLLFFNHWFKKRFNEEPSPLEVEIFNYQRDLDQYAARHENTLDDS